MLTAAATVVLSASSCAEPPRPQTARAVSGSRSDEHDGARRHPAPRVFERDIAAKEQARLRLPPAGPDGYRLVPAPGQYTFRGIWTGPGPGAPQIQMTMQTSVTGQPQQLRVRHDDGNMRTDESWSVRDSVAVVTAFSEEVGSDREPYQRCVWSAGLVQVKRTMHTGDVWENKAICTESAPPHHGEPIVQTETVRVIGQELVRLGDHELETLKLERRVERTRTETYPRTYVEWFAPALGIRVKWTVRVGEDAATDSKPQQPAPTGKTFVLDRRSWELTSYSPDAAK